MSKKYSVHLSYMYFCFQKDELSQEEGGMWPIVYSKDNVYKG